MSVEAGLEILNDVNPMQEDESPELSAAQPRYLSLDEVPHAAIALGGLSVVISLYCMTLSCSVMSI